MGFKLGLLNITKSTSIGSDARVVLVFRLLALGLVKHLVLGATLMNVYPQKAIRSRRAFTLIELVIVILILGILAAVAAPRMFDTATNARTSATRHSLTVVRDAIQLYRAQNGALPGEVGTELDLKNDLINMLNGPFPRSEVGNVGDSVRIQNTGAALTVSGVESWAYDNVSGEFKCNSAAGSNW